MLLAVCPQILAETPHILSHTHIVYNQDRCCHDSKWASLHRGWPAGNSLYFVLSSWLSCIYYPPQMSLFEIIKEVGFGWRVKVSTVVRVTSFQSLRNLSFPSANVSVLRSQLAVWFGLKVRCFHLMKDKYIASMSYWYRILPRHQHVRIWAHVAMLIGKMMIHQWMEGVFSPNRSVPNP